MVHRYVSVRCVNPMDPEGQVLEADYVLRSLNSLRARAFNLYIFPIRNYCEIQVIPGDIYVSCIGAYFLRSSIAP